MGTMSIYFRQSPRSRGIEGVGIIEFAWRRFCRTRYPYAHERADTPVLGRRCTAYLKIRRPPCTYTNASAQLDEKAASVGVHWQTTWRDVFVIHPAVARQSVDESMPRRHEMLNGVLPAKCDKFSSPTAVPCCQLLQSRSIVWMF